MSGLHIGLTADVQDEYAGVLIAESVLFSAVFNRVSGDIARGVFFLLSAGVPVGVVVARAQRSRTTIAAALESVFENEEVPEPGREFLRSRLFYVSSDATAAWEDGPVASFVDEVRRLHEIGRASRRETV